MESHDNTPQPHPPQATNRRLPVRPPAAASPQNRQPAAPAGASRRPTAAAVRGRSSGKGATARRRTARVQQRLREALDNEGSLESLLGAVGSDLAGLAFRVRDALEAEMDASPDLAAGLQELAPTVAAYLKLTGQLKSFAQLEYRLARDRRADEERRKALEAPGEGEETLEAAGESEREESPT